MGQAAWITKEQKILYILGIKINKVTKSQALEKVSTFLESNKQYKIFTPNPEMLVDAHKDEYFREILNEGDLNLCDGFGLSVFTRTKRITGVDFMLDICKLAQEKDKSVYFLGAGSKEVIEKLVKNIEQQFPNLKVVGFHPGNNITIEQYNNRTILSLNKEQNNDLIADIIMTQPDILFVAFGHGKQEKWIYENLKDMPSVKIAMGVGGAFDFI